MKRWQLDGDEDVGGGVGVCVGQLKAGLHTGAMTEPGDMG